MAADGFFEPIKMSGVPYNSSGGRLSFKSFVLKCTRQIGGDVLSRSNL
ncbi:hypothetical protein [Rhizobium sp. A37_96]